MNSAPHTVEHKDCMHDKQVGSLLGGFEIYCARNLEFTWSMFRLAESEAGLVSRSTG